ncbi:NAD-dependent succinate-semialdehyde dehydrogenase [Nocardioides sp.]|jgi:succinate-semialdehyde dehydrogenase/glutarate-semialdehyde dehydrogenase|uniref:NAD-dependent succinate-semialdehyde dehydrogenase n=1 Tax=Nocardioides sp. TaxID=35761 RepID=UPI002BDB7026|nr:NAD-dependent succinate-semialdehyde dehydrogenase [Nocardioides sp.]HVX55667.1 NAD-dependent succinate-semialdehyde dehydrogenase [Nocardioides sp.]
MSGLDLVGPEQRGLFIGGAWRDAQGGEDFAVLDPADGSVLTRVADASVEDALDALDAAAAAQAEWARTAPRTRGEILRSAFELIAERADDFAELMSLEMGKTIAEAKGEVTYGNEFFRWFSEEAVRIHGRWMQAPAGGSRLLTMKKPVGPCLFVTPWNFPLAMGTRKIGPAIAAGCTMVVKPAELTPLTMLALAGVLTEAGLPAGVLNVIPSTRAADISKALMADDRLRKVSFTGSTPVGKVLVRQSADNLQRVSMELGGNAPFLVFEDADLDAAVEGAMVAKMRNMGEACTAANRFLVHADVAEEFAKRLSERMGALTVGRGQTEGVDVGPLIEEKAVESVHQLVTDAVHDGATVVTGGTAPDGPGFFYNPTVLLGVHPESEINTHEIFGPVAPITTFATEEEAIERANATEYGLSSYVYTRDLARTIRLAESLDYGMVGVNTGLVSNPAAPFGGVKSSGFGREGGFEGIEEYLDTTYVAIPAD